MVANTTPGEAIIERAAVPDAHHILFSIRGGRRVRAGLTRYLRKDADSLSWKGTITSST